VTRADETHLAVQRKANTMSWPVKKIIMKGQHVELAGKKMNEKANTLSWLVKIYMKSETADVRPST
jgi:hypothetical protein